MRDPIQNQDVRDLLAAVLEALDIPHPATIGDGAEHYTVLADRVMHAKIALRSVEDGSSISIAWTTAYLREQLAKHPATGYRPYGAPKLGAGR